MKLPLFLIAGLIALAGANEVPPVFENESGQILPGGQVAVGTQVHLSHPDAGPGLEGTIYYTLDGSDPRYADLSNVDSLVSYEDERFYHVPTSAADGFLLNPPLSIAPIAHYTFDEDGTDSAPSGGSQNAVFSFGTSVTSNALTTGALSFSRDNEHATLGDPVALHITGPISIST
ncbi:MAG: chitobiase/beta-hexosaminidase C-terminal domain-containing protein, partial [Verrucomicrobiales bacterium]